jgi:hypothetical protein
VEAFAATLVARPQTQRTYERACRRFARWLGALAGPENLTAANVAPYHAHLVACGRSSAAVKTTSIYLASGEDRQEEIVRLRDRGRATLDDDREAAGRGRPSRRAAAGRGSLRRPWRSP